ncbi:sushi, von Willebrand factor type A, EGF and pentraxin domain-containing protein 1-like, partial [Saccostrea cucullata]|uniref:sushi, von Willebrand factor type A, EGF and pentraxin domain-containing protein 1-like n=1 Tax=Saccostrea cuccullata TaxID=36930 RepID=UPI002ED061A2
ICPPGEEFNSTSKTCGKCALGYYKSTTGNSEPCTKCPDGNTTLVIGSVSSAACNISDCLPGTYRSSGAGCKECPAGTFQDEKSQTSCQKCPANKNITETTGATSDSYCIVSCGDGSQYDRTLDNCTACPKDFYTNRKISQYCIKCPSGFITYGAGSSECVPQAPGTTAAPVIKQQTFIFTLSYKLFLDCQVPDAVNSALANIRARIIHRLLALASRFANFCRKINVQECFLSVRVQSNVCKTARRKKRNASPVDLDVKVDIPDVSSTVTDTEEPTKILQTESMLKEDLDTNKPEYAPQGTELVSSRFEGKVITCENGSVPASNNETCVICTEGTYHNTEMGKCENCPRNFYQDQNQQITCKPCSGSVKIFTVSEGSNSQSQCVSECSTNPNYCKNGGKCNFNDVTIWCTCKERYSGSRCGEQAEYTSDTPYIIGGTVGGLAAIMVVALVIICLIRCLKRSKESTSKYPPSEPMEYFYDYNTPFYDNSSKRGGISSHARMNPAFNYDDGSFYDTRNRMYPQEDDDYRGYRWQEARGDFDL